MPSRVCLSNRTAKTATSCASSRFWESKAHKDRYEAELLLPAFQAAGIAAAVGANTEFAECEAATLYRR